MSDFFDRRNPSPFRRPAETAKWTRDSTGTKAPRVDVDAIVEQFGLRVRTVPGLPRNGQLTVDDEGLAIHVRPCKPTVHRFTTAHELGHYLLATQGGVKLVTQAADRRYEAYCNQYASHLLLPRDWLRTVIREDRPSLPQALAVARITGTSLLSAFVAVNDACQWNGVLVMWERHGTRPWSPTKVVGSHGCGIVQSAHDTDRQLGRVDGSATDIVLPLTVAGRPHAVHAQAVRFRDRCFSIFDIAQLGEIGRGDRRRLA